jgi:lipopolysaccharide transport system ATP-binding protein
MESFLARRGTLIFCSHSSFQVKKLCQQALWLHHGRAQSVGAAHTVVQEYLEYLENQEREKEKEAGNRAEASLLAGENRVRGVRVLNGKAEEAREFRLGEPLRVEVAVEVGRGEENPPVVGIGLLRTDGVPVYGVSTDMDGVTPRQTEERLYSIQYELPTLSLLPGRYLVRVHCLDGAGLRVFATVEREIVVRGETREVGLCRLPHRWVLP